jgi:hypothetical protein
MAEELDSLNAKVQYLGLFTIFLMIVVLLLGVMVAILAWKMKQMRRGTTADAIEMSNMEQLIPSSSAEFVEEDEGAE